MNLRTEMDWSNALVIVCFPATGSVASIAGHYLRKKLDLPLLGSLRVPRPLPVVAVQNGLATGDIRVYGGETVCNLGDEPCPRVAIILSDLPVDPEHLSGISAAILQAAANSRLVLSFDGVGRDEGDDKPDVFSIAAGPKALKELNVKNATAMPDALLGGLTAQLLLDARDDGVGVGALIVEAREKIPDGRAAAALIKAVDQLLPTVPVDSAPLLKEAEELEKRVRKAQSQVDLHGHPQQRHDRTFI